MNMLRSSRTAGRRITGPLRSTSAVLGRCCRSPAGMRPLCVSPPVSAVRGRPDSLVSSCADGALDRRAGSRLYRRLPEDVHCRELVFSEIGESGAPARTCAPYRLALLRVAAIKPRFPARRVPGSVKRTWHRDVRRVLAGHLQRKARVAARDGLLRAEERVAEVVELVEGARVCEQLAHALCEALPVQRQHLALRRLLVLARRAEICSHELAQR